MNKIAVNPNDTSTIWNKKPQATPAKEISPAFLPWVIERDIRYIILGPGVITITKAASINNRRDDKGIMAQEDCKVEAAARCARLNIKAL